MIQTVLLRSTRVFNPETGKMDTPYLTIEIDPYTKCIIFAELFCSPTDDKEGCDQ